jgi:arginase family enzyme
MPNMTRAFTVIGVPVSAGAHHGGLERAPAALRAAGLLDRLRQAGCEVSDGGDLPSRVFTADPAHPRARNQNTVVQACQDVAAAAGQVMARGDIPVLVGGDCSITAERHLLNLPLSHADDKKVAADPAGAAAAARQHVEASADAIVVHFDVDVIDSADLPLANYPNFGKGVNFDAAMTVLRELCASPALAAWC